MAWKVRHSRIFLKELARLPVGVRNHIEAVAFGEAIKHDPYLGGKVEKGETGKLEARRLYDDQVQGNFRSCC